MHVQSVRKTLTVLTLGLVLWVPALPCAAQSVATVTGMIDKTTRAAVESGAVCLTRFDSLAQSRRLRVGEELFAGDMLDAGPCSEGFGEAPDLVVELVCEESGTRMVLSGDFLAVMEPPVDEAVFEPASDDCVLQLGSGVVDVIARGKTRLQLGQGVWLGSESTLYSVTQECEPPCEEGGREPGTCSVFEGSVWIRSPDRYPRVEAGASWVWGEGIRDTIEPDMLEETAWRLALWDGWKAAGEYDQGLMDELQILYRDMLGNARDTGARERWLDLQDQLGLIESRDGRDRAELDPYGSTRNPRPAVSREPAAGPMADLLAACADAQDDGGVASCSLAEGGEDVGQGPTVLLSTEKGWIRLSFPPDLRAGETVSGSMDMGIGGKAKKRDKFLKQLAEYGVLAGSRKLPVDKGPFSVQLPQGDTLKLALVNRRGKVQVERSLPLKQEPRERSARFAAPAFCAAGQSLVLTGPFDGDMGNTLVSFGESRLSTMQETMASTTVVCPATPGRGTLKLWEGYVAAELRDFYVLGYEFDVQVNELSRGLTTTATVRVTGLEGFEQSVGLLLRNTRPESVRIDGAEQGQWLRYAPASWAGTGTFTRAFTVTALKAGTSTLNPRLVPFQWYYLQRAEP